MYTHHFTIGMALVLLIGVVGTADAKTQHFHCTGSETFLSGLETNIDTNGDGVSADVAQGIEICNTGKALIQEEVEWSHQSTVTTCPTGTTDEFHIDSTQGQQRSVATDTKTGDQVFTKVTSGTLCVQFATFPFTSTGTVQFEVIGGTGKAAGATGSGESHFAGSFLQFGFKGGAGGPFGGFGQITFTADGTLNLPNAGNGHDGNENED
jgi:hypothetical protein